MKVEIEIEVKGEKVKLTLAEARELHTQLGALFPTPPPLYPVYPWDNPWWKPPTPPNWPEITWAPNTSGTTCVGKPEN